MKKLFKKVLVLLVSFLLLITMVGCGSNNKETNETTEPNTSDVVEARTAIIFKEIDGNSATIKRNGSSESSYEGMRLMADDEIITDVNTSVYLRVDDDKNILLDKDSSMSISELKDGKLRLRLNYGEFFFEVVNKLGADEEVNFDVGSTTMSIRGTSGGGRLRDDAEAVSLFTGEAKIQNRKGFEVTLKASMMLTVNPSEGTYRMSGVTLGDVSGVAQYYYDNDKNFQGRVEGTVSGQILSGEEGNVGLDNEPATVGWVQLADGTWVYGVEGSQEASKPYEEKPAAPRKPEKQEEKKGTDEPVPAPAPAVREKLPCGHYKDQVKIDELGKHALIKDAKSYLVKLNPIFDDTNFDDACDSHYLCKLDLPTDSEGNLTEEALRIIFKHIVPCSSCGELECSPTFLDNHTLDDEAYICNRRITLRLVDEVTHLDDSRTVIPADFVGGIEVPILESTSDKQFSNWSANNTHLKFTVSSEGCFVKLADNEKLSALTSCTEVTLTAKWNDITPTTATLTLNGNGGVFSDGEKTVILSLPSETETYSVNSILKVNGMSVSNGDYVLVGWRSGDNKVHTSDEEFITSSTGVLDAIWGHKVTFVVYDEDGPFSSKVTEVAHGGTVSIPEEYAEFDSLRWFDGSEPFDFNTPINSDKTLNGYFPS